MKLLERARVLLGRRRTATPGHTETARETSVMLGLMGNAAAAGPDMTDEQRLLLIQAAPGMRAREAFLLGIPNRSSVEENELHMIRREMARIEGRNQQSAKDAPTAAPRRFAFLGAAAGASPWLAILTSPLTWIAAGVAAFGVQTARLEHAKHDLTEARRIAVHNRVASEQWRAEFTRAHNEVIHAQQNNAETAQLVEAERARVRRYQQEARRIAREAERARAGAGAIDYGFGGVRDPEPSEGSAAPDSGHPAGGGPG